MRIQNMLCFLKEQDIPFDFIGDETTEIRGFSSLKNYKKNTMTWAKNELAYQFTFEDKLLLIAQSGLITNAQNTIVSEQSKRAFFSLIEYMADAIGQDGSCKESIGQNTIIRGEVTLGKGVRIGHNCTIDGDISIGENTRIGNNVTIINSVSVGSCCEIQSGCVIGHDGFAWTEDSLRRKRMVRHFGGVEIGNDVYIGPNSIIDRGEIDCTVVRDGARIDADCFIAHNVVIGRNSVLIAGCRLYGSSEIGDNGYVASAIVRNQCRVGKGALIGMGAVVTRDIPAGVIVAGVPAKVIRKRAEE